jgi:hypothetical protein
MTDTTRGIRKRIEELNRKLDEIESAAKESSRLLFWRGKKIISVKQWQSIAKKGYCEEAIKYIPNGFITRPMEGLVSENETGHGYNDERRYKWVDDYYGYLDYSRDPQLGKMNCGKCLLLDDEDQEVAFTGSDLRKIVRKFIQSSSSLKSLGRSSSISSSSSNPTTHSIDHSSSIQRKILAPANEQNVEKNATVIKKQQSIMIEYPCPVQNRFECPYHKYSEINDSLLVGIGEDINSIYDALSHAQTLTYQTRDYTYKVDSEKGRLLETIHKYGRRSSGDSSIRLEVGLVPLKQPRVPIASIRDIYKALTNREDLDVLLEQYFEHRRKNPLDYGDNPSFDPAKRKEQNDILRHSIVDWFMQIKEHLRIEDLTDFYGMTLQEEEENTRSSLGESAPRFVDHSNDICNECNRRWACILCVNCNKWICADHRLNHRSTYHMIV